MLLTTGMLAESSIENSEGFAIHDYEGFSSLEISENDSIETVIDLAFFIVKYEELGAQLLADYSIDDAERLLKESYYGAYDSEVDFVYSIFEECYRVC